MAVRLRPFFCYFGGKWRAAPIYPKPRFDDIVEPFAGAAGYSTLYHDRRVTIIDKDETIAALWAYLIRAKESEILSLPVEVDDVRYLNVCSEAKSLIGFWLNKGASRPSNKPSTWAKSNKTSFWGQRVRAMIASQVSRVRHWRVVCGDYQDAPECKATWFIDPPYFEAGENYRCSMAHDEYRALADWCKSRHGQVIVCEAAGASWLPFQPLARIKANPSRNGKGRSFEVMWQKGEA